MKYTPEVASGSQSRPQKGTKVSHEKAQEAQLSRKSAELSGKLILSFLCVFVANLCATLWLAFGALEDRVADFDAVGDGENARLLALAAILQ